MNTRYKRPLDLFILVTAHVVPPMFIIWILVWAIIPTIIWLQDRGPVFYSQKRLGKNGKVFLIRKFRTMVQNAESKTGPVWSIQEDDRITPFGKILRWTAIDELPQILNILKGEMSFVGPRAERPELHDIFVSENPAFEKRLQVTPGLTGLAQIKGSYDLPASQKLEYDLEYIDNMTLRKDIALIIISIWNTLQAKWDRPGK